MKLKGDTNNRNPSRGMLKGKLLMRKFDQCPNCYHTIEYIDGVTYCVICDDIVVENENAITYRFISFLSSAIFLK